jgi:broad specificity phosphatase PhoE
MELLLVRHARPEVVSGVEVADPPLTDEGRAQAQLMAKAVAGGHYGAVTAVVSSSMRRAVETAAPLVEALGVVVETDVRLVELDHGWTSYGAGLDAYPSRRAAYAAMNVGRWGTNTFEPLAFRERVRAGMEAVVDRYPDRTVAVVCHGGVISAYLAHVLDVSQTVFFAPDYCSVTRILAEPDGHRELLTANEALHMRLP